MAKYNIGDKVCFFVAYPEDNECYCGEGVVSSVMEDPDTEDVFVFIGGDCYNDDEIFSSWQELAECACRKLKSEYIMLSKE